MRDLSSNNSWTAPKEQHPRLTPNCHTRHITHTSYLYSVGILFRYLNLPETGIRGCTTKKKKKKFRTKYDAELKLIIFWFGVSCSHKQASDSLHCCTWPWISDSSVSTSSVMGLQVCATHIVWKVLEIKVRVNNWATSLAKARIYQEEFRYTAPM